MIVLTPVHVPSSCPKQMLGNKNDAVEFNGQAIRHEQNPVLRIGDEVFLSSPKRLSAKDTNFVVFGLSPFEAP